ncbi:hypothetical protein M413DRAFT_32943 [Hebeloma cylindrosporum]|uniref:Uncharacterized protein n=1 Tax=Hebeloma cylindrosporum TaxID=76867 RepID=A0A0C3BS37_HEBCY|nr:hypothetical protein M413DRAFT_32943 [Hebeloma cylindrosporum h7]
MAHHKISSSSSPQAMPPKSKAQPPNPDRVTRSQRAPVPDIPLPPRREPPRRKKLPPPQPDSNSNPNSNPPRPRPLPRPATASNKPQTLEDEDNFFISSRAGWKPLHTNQTHPLPSPPATSAPPFELPVFSIPYFTPTFPLGPATGKSISGPTSSSEPPVFFIPYFTPAFPTTCYTTAGSSSSLCS